jgi:hypothetical protein
MRRRAFLQSAATAATVASAGDVAATDSARDHDDGGREDFVWTQGPVVADARMRDLYLALADRLDLAVVVSSPDATDPGGVERVEAVLQAAADRDVPVWLNTGVLNAATAEEFVGDEDARRTELQGLRRIVGVYHEYEPEGRVILWQEAPVSGEWVAGGAWTAGSVDNLREYGPAVYAAQYRAVKAVSRGLDAGIFVHFPYVVDSKHPETFQDLAADIGDRGVVPDFAFTDFYRGYYEANTGAADANDAVRSLVSNARRGVGGRPVFYMGEPHTINNGYTPSKAAMAMDHRTAAAAGAAGLGWYPRPQYVRTRTGFDPYLPNDDDRDAAGDPRATTATFARDRFQYAYARLAASRPEARDRFDLWLDLDDADTFEHAVHLRGDGWTHVGDAAGYLDAPDGRHVTVLRGLDRDRFARGGRVLVRVESRGRATLRALAAMPFAPDAFVSEWEATDLADRGLRPYALGYRDLDADLRPARTVAVTVRVSPPARPFDALVYPDHRDIRRALARFEARDGFDPDAHLDLWATGQGLDADALRGLPGDPPGDAAAVVAHDDCAVLYGLPRDPYLDAVRDANADALPVDAAYAMPYAGLGAFRTGVDAGRAVESFPGDARTFSLAAVGGYSSE